MDAVVDETYRKIYEDERINELFKGVNMGHLKSMMKSFLRKSTGGEGDGSVGKYDGKNMYEAHKHANKGKFPTEDQFNVIGEIFVGTMVEFNVSQDVIAEVGGLVASLKPQVLGFENPEKSDS